MVTNLLNGQPIGVSIPKLVFSLFMLLISGPMVAQTEDDSAEELSPEDLELIEQLQADSIKGQTGKIVLSEAN